MKTKTQNQTGKLAQSKINQSWQSSSSTEKTISPANDEHYFAKNKNFIPNTKTSLPFQKPTKLMVRKRKQSQQPLRQIRTQRDLTLHRLAEITGLSSSYLSRLESGSRRFNVEILQKLAHALSCNVSALLPYDSQDQPDISNPSNPMAFNTTNSGYFNNQNSPDLPLYHIKRTKDKFQTIELDSPYGWTHRPFDLQGIPNAISFQLSEEYKGQRYRAGDQIYGHPTRPLSQNCSVLAITQDDCAHIGEFVGWSSQGANNLMILRSYEATESKEHSNDDLIHVPQDSVKAIYRIIGSFESA